MSGTGDDRADHQDRRPPVLTVLCGQDRPPVMGDVESRAEVRYTGPEGLSEALRGADALFVWDFLSRAVEGAWSAADSLRWVHIAGAGVDNLLFPGLVEGDVTLTNSRGVFDDSIAEYVLGTVLAFAKDIPGSLALQREKRWQHRETERVAGRAALIVGTGAIGGATARLLHAAGLRVWGIGRHAREHDPDFGTVYPSERLLDQLPHAEFVVVLAPLTEQTRGMFCEAAFHAMRPEARLINVGRGELVVTTALIDALRAGRLAGAALDVFENEPLDSESPLWSMTNVMISPHMSGDFVGWKRVLAERFVANFRRWIAGDELDNVVDKRHGYVPSHT